MHKCIQLSYFGIAYSWTPPETPWSKGMSFIERSTWIWAVRSHEVVDPWIIVYKGTVSGVAEYLGQEPHTHKSLEEQATVFQVIEEYARLSLYRGCWGQETAAVSTSSYILTFWFWARFQPIKNRFKFIDHSIFLSYDIWP